MRQVAIGASVLLVAGCASSLNVYDAHQRAVVGVPFRATEVYVKAGLHNRHSEHGEDCTATPFVQTVSLPTGSQYFVNVDPAQLAKTGFEVEFNDAGGLRSVTLNSEPSAADTVDSVAGALSTLLPFAGVTAETAPAQTPQPSQAGRPACDVGETNVRFVRLADYTPNPATGDAH